MYFRAQDKYNFKRPNHNQLKKVKNKNWNFVSTSHTYYFSQSQKEKEAESQPFTKVESKKPEVFGE